jgi:SAM-dependent methyltransferase
LRNSSCGRSELSLFFDEHAALFLHKPEITLRDLCHVSGRDYRVWTDSVYKDLIASIVSMLDLSPQTDLLEVGCAAGFLALGLSREVREYHGVDLSSTSLKLARRLGLTNAWFRPGDGTGLPFADGQFDRAVCYDVFTNISDLEVCRRIIAEMARVTKAKGRFLIGSLADARTQSAYEQRVCEVGEGLAPIEEDPDIASRCWMPWRYKLLEKWRRVGNVNPPSVVCYYFQPDFFVEVAHSMGLEVDIMPIHPLNPYVGYRFNALFRK